MVQTAAINADNDVRKMFMARIGANEISAADAQKFHWHAVNLLLAKRIFIHYHGLVSGGIPEWVYDVIRSAP